MIRIQNFDDLQCRLDTTTREILERIDRTEQKFQLILDDEGRLVGTVTDGDIRRAMLAGAQIDDPVSRCMHADPVIGHPQTEDENSARLQRLPFLPIVDDDGKLVEILVPGSIGVGINTALVMAGGAGRRLGERTRTTPKPLVHIDGRPILDYILAALEDEDIPNIYVSVHHLAEQIKDFIENRANRSAIALLPEERPLGTAGAVGRLPHDLSEPVLVLNGDVITDVNLSALRSFHDRHGHDATVAVARYDVEIPYGVVRHSDEGVFETIVEKPTVNHFVAAGIYYLAPEFCALVPRDSQIDMPELLSLGRSAGLSIGLFPIHEYWIDVGRPDDLETAERDLNNAK